MPEERRGYSQRLETGVPLWHMGALFTFLADGSTTDGRYALKEFIVRPGAEPPPHTHTHEDEAFYVLEGQFRFSVGDQEIDAGPGSFVFLPRGLTHGFAVQTPTGRGLSMYTPAGLEDAFRELSEPAPEATLPPLPSGPPDPEHIRHLIDVFRSRGVEFQMPDL